MEAEAELSRIIINEMSDQQIIVLGVFPLLLA